MKALYVPGKGLTITIHVMYLAAILEVKIEDHPIDFYIMPLDTYESLISSWKGLNYYYACYVFSSN